MNWLAHMLLSEPEIEFQLGNLLADLVKGPARADMTLLFQQGMRRHQAIDIFTDAHPVVARSRARIGREYRRVAGILVDVFFDHFLALGWDRYCVEPLEVFTARLYAEFRAHPLRLPHEVQLILERMQREDWLASYRHMAGIQSALHRISRRLEARAGNDFGIVNAVSELQTHFGGLENDFAEFFPLLQAYVAAD